MPNPENVRRVYILGEYPVGQIECPKVIITNSENILINEKDKRLVSWTGSLQKGFVSTDLTDLFPEGRPVIKMDKDRIYLPMMFRQLLEGYVRKSVELEKSVCDVLAIPSDLGNMYRIPMPLEERLSGMLLPFAQ